MGKNPVETEPAASNDPVEPEIVTAPVTAWAAVGLTEEEWNALEIPPVPAPYRTDVDCPLYPDQYGHHQRRLRLPPLPPHPLGLRVAQLQT
jgi:hypothetical protein